MPAQGITRRRVRWADISLCRRKTKQSDCQVQQRIADFGNYQENNDLVAEAPRGVRPKSQSRSVKETTGVKKPCGWPTTAPPVTACGWRLYDASDSAVAAPWSAGARNGPVAECVDLATASGVPAATTRPPPAPPSG